MSFEIPFSLSSGSLSKGRDVPFPKGMCGARDPSAATTTAMAAMAMRNGARLPRRSDRSERVTRVRAGRTEGGPRVAVVGVSGAVGQEFLRVREASRMRSEGNQDETNATFRR